MSAIEFVASLLESGRVRVARRAEPPEDLGAAVLELDRSARPGEAFEPPALAAEAGAWALTVLYRGCQSLVYREIDGDAVRDALSQPCPLPASPAVCWSADLSLRYLPDLLALARGVAGDDPLVAGLTGLARRWPLSSVGVGEMKDPDVSAFIDHPSLRQLYVDRVIERGDLSRLSHPLVREAARAALGARTELAPQVAAALERVAARPEGRAT